MVLVWYGFVAALDANLVNCNKELAAAGMPASINLVHTLSLHPMQCTHHRFGEAVWFFGCAAAGCWCWFVETHVCLATLAGEGGGHGIELGEVRPRWAAPLRRLPKKSRSSRWWWASWFGRMSRSIAGNCANIAMHWWTTSIAAKLLVILLGFGEPKRFGQYMWESYKTVLFKGRLLVKIAETKTKQVEKWECSTVTRYITLETGLVVTGGWRRC